MTAARQEMEDGQRVRRPKLGQLAVVLAVAAGLVGQMVGGARATTTERVVVDRKSGLAISGFDPVGYFTDAHPIAGVASTEASYDGAIWRFRNEGNRIAFMAHPEIYAPCFGGFDPVDLARGKTVESYPSLWLIAGQRLYLFSSEANRATFAKDAARYIDTAERRWPYLRETLAQ